MMIDYSKVDIVPNPVVHFAILSIPGSIIHPYTFQLLNERGNKVEEWNNIFSNKFIISGKYLKPGAYFYKLFSGDKKQCYYGKLKVG
jgi:hypothetical protein